MWAVVVDRAAAGGVRVASDHPRPKCGPGEALIRVRAAGICSTDLEIVRGYMSFDGVPGHEFVGDVVEGPDTLLGRRVVGEINCACGACATCRAGRPNHCPTRTVLGIAGRDGAFADYLALPASNCHIVPDSIRDEEAVFVEPLAAAVHVLDAFDYRAEMSVAVIGPGRLGTLVARVLALQACELTVIGRPGPRLDRLQRDGLRTLDAAQLISRRDFDVVIECSGAADGLRLALDVVQPCGAIVLKSTYATPAGLDLAPIVIHEISVLGSRCGPFDEALDLLEMHYVRVDDLITAEFSLAAAPEALAVAARPEHLKVLLRPGA